MFVQMYLINPPPAINAQRIGVRFSLKKIGKSDVVTVLNRPPLNGATPFRIISQECSRMNYFEIQCYWIWLMFVSLTSFDIVIDLKIFWIDSNYILSPFQLMLLLIHLESYQYRPPNRLWKMQRGSQHPILDYLRSRSAKEK